MKWTPIMEAKLKELCFDNRSNAELAKIFNCDLKDIHAKRSQLGITIPKVKAAQQQAAIPATKPFHRTSTKDIKANFKKLRDSLLVAIGTDWTTKDEMVVFNDTYNLIINTESLFDQALAACK